MTDTLALLSPLRNTFRWDRRFSQRQLGLYDAADIRVPPQAKFPNRTKVERFLHAWPSLLDPPCCSYEPLREFLTRNKNSEAELEDPRRWAELKTLALLDDRRDPAGLRPTSPGQPIESDGQTRDWESEEYSVHPTEGEDKWRKALNERALYKRLSKLVSAGPCEMSGTDLHL
jgi:hypothetical protein